MELLWIQRFTGYFGLRLLDRPQGAHTLAELEESK